MKEKVLNFQNELNHDFVMELKQRVTTYFRERNITRFGNGVMFGKTLFMLLLYFIPYSIMLSGWVSNPWVFYTLWLIMGLGMAGIGLSIMHDANHGSYSKNKRLNRILGGLIHLVGGSSVNWRIQHNRLHHSYTNVAGLDEDINTNLIMRFSPEQKRYKIHRLQFIYAWFFYSLMTLYWATAKDFIQMIRYKNNGLISMEKFNTSFWAMLSWKVFYYIYILVLPLILVPQATWLILVSFISMHLVAGFILSCIFQTAHVVPSSEFPSPDKDGRLANSWAVHQLMTTANFAPKSRIFSWFIGGLNFQVEHHLFPNICHIHYKKISSIVARTASEWKLPYHYNRTFLGALWQHAKMLRELGKPVPVS